MDWGYSLVVEYLPSTQGELSSTPAQEKEKKTFTMC
jgi:hypothetical protein